MWRKSGFRAIEVLFAKAALNFGRSSSAIKAFWRTRTDLRYAPSAPEGLKHHRGIIKQMVGHAMRSCLKSCGSIWVH